MLGRMRLLCQKLQFKIGETLVTCSIGGVRSQDVSREFETLYRAADMSLVMAKELGKNKFRMYGEKQEVATLKMLKNLGWLLEKNPQGIIIIDVDTREIMYANTSVCERYLKLEKDRIVGHKCFEVIAGRDKRCDECPLSDNKCLDVAFPCKVSEERIEEEVTVTGKITVWDNQTIFVQVIDPV
jgi:hypothetical protein